MDCSVVSSKRCGRFGLAGCAIYSSYYSHPVTRSVILEGVCDSIFLLGCWRMAYFSFRLLYFFVTAEPRRPPTLCLLQLPPASWRPRRAAAWQHRPILDTSSGPPPFSGWIRTKVIFERENFFFFFIHIFFSNPPTNHQRDGMIYNSHLYFIWFNSCDLLSFIFK